MARLAGMRPPWVCSSRENKATIAALSTSRYPRFRMRQGPKHSRQLRCRDGWLMAELLDIGPVLDELKLSSGLLAQARFACIAVIDRDFEDGGDLAATIAARLQRYREAKNNHDPDLVRKAERVEKRVIDWQPVLKAVRGIVVSVSLETALAIVGSTGRVLAERQKIVERNQENFERLLRFSVQIRSARTRDELVEVLLALSPDDLERLHAASIDTGESFNEELAKLQGIAELEILAETEIAETFDTVREFLEARREVLKNYVKATDYFSGLEPERKMGRTATKQTVIKSAKVAGEFFVTKVLPKSAQQIPAVGIPVAAAEIMNEMRKTRKEFREKTEHLRELATAREARGATDEIYYLGRTLSGDTRRLAKLKAQVERLGELVAELARTKLA
jgi:hypothetical protein